MGHFKVLKGVSNIDFSTKTRRRAARRRKSLNLQLHYDLVVVLEPDTYPVHQVLEPDTYPVNRVIYTDTSGTQARYIPGTSLFESDTYGRYITNHC